MGMGREERGHGASLKERERWELVPIPDGEQWRRDRGTGDNCPLLNFSLSEILFCLKIVVQNCKIWG